MAPAAWRICALLGSASCAAALYFTIADSSPRCFIEEVPGDTLVVGIYTNRDFAPYGGPGWTGIGLSVSVTDPGKATLMSQALEAAGRFSFTSSVGGEYFICFASNASSIPRLAMGKARFRLDLTLAVGETGIDYAQVAQREHLSELEVAVRRLNDKLKDIVKEQGYARGREEQFRSSTEAIHARVTYLSIAQVAVMVIAGLWQISHLKSFFSRKKIA